ncbi:MAG: hypothetical protein ACTHKH_01130 [Trinickia sp.]
MNQRQVPVLVVPMFAGVGLVSAMGALAQSPGSVNGVDRGTPCMK